MNYICNICGKEFETKQKLGGHKIIHLPKNKYICPYCGKEFFTSQSAFNHHVTQTHINIDKDTNSSLSEFNSLRDDLFCQYCGRQCKNKNSLINHERLCVSNPDHQDKEYLYRAGGGWNKGLPAWNSGLTKETSDIIAKSAEKWKENYKKGIYKKPLGKGSTEEVETERKKKLSTFAKNNNNFWKLKRKHIVEYNGFKFDSTYEVIVAKSLDSNGVCWEKPKSFKYIFNSVEHTYTPDFYLPDYDLYLDPKNDFLIENINPGTGYNDVDKIRAVEKQNNIRVLILNKNQLTWEEIKNLI